MPVSPSSISWKSRCYNTWGSQFFSCCRPLVRTLIFYSSHLCKWLSSNFVNFVFIFQLSPLFRKNFSQLQKSRYCPWKLPLLNIFFFNSCIKFVKMLVSLFFRLWFCCSRKINLYFCHRVLYLLGFKSDPLSAWSPVKPTKIIYGGWNNF